MKAEDIRTWLGAYVLGLVGTLGAWLLLAPDQFLPLESDDRTASFEIVVPFLLAQVTAVYRFYTSDVPVRAPRRRMPAWLVRTPIIMTSVLLLATFVLAGVGGARQDEDITPSAEQIRGMLAFCVAILNASTVLVISRYFASDDTKAETTTGAPSPKAVAGGEET